MGSEKLAALTNQTYDIVKADGNGFVDPDRAMITAMMITSGIFERAQLKISRKLAWEVLSRLVYKTLKPSESKKRNRPSSARL